MNSKTKYAMINSIIAGGLVFVGAFSDGSVSPVAFISALSASIAVFLTGLKTHFNKSGIVKFYGR
jgi:hypothetical protein